MKTKTSESAFPYFFNEHNYSNGMSLRDWFAGQALQNNSICTGCVADSQLEKWFGKNCYNIGRNEILAKQAYELADAMITSREATE